MPEDRVAVVQRLFLAHAPALRAYVLALLPDFNRSQDVLQETFLTATRKAADFAPDSNFLAWACAIARYKVLEARRHPTGGPLLSAEALDALCASDAAEPADPRLDLLRQCLDGLAPRALSLIHI
jgi:RNA polymerase sigma-70 factor (ECF subfamily)